MFFWRRIMYKDVVTCNTCESFYVTPDGASMCKNKKGLPFPTAVDFCSNGVLSTTTRTVDNGELLKLVYEQRRNG